MPQRCVAAGCDRRAEGEFSLHKFPKDAARRAEWSKQVAKTRLDWTAATDYSVLCSLHFTKDSYETSVLLSEEMGLPTKKHKLKDSAVPTLFPKPNAIKTGSMEWAYGSIHYPDSETSIASSDTSNTRFCSRSAVIKRKRAKVC